VHQTRIIEGREGGKEEGYAIIYIMSSYSATRGRFGHAIGPPRGGLAKVESL